MILRKLIRNWRHSVGTCPEASARCGQLFLSSTVMAIASWLSSIAFSAFRKESIKDDVLLQNRLLQNNFLQPAKRKVLHSFAIIPVILGLFFVPSVFAATGGGAVIHNAATVFSSSGNYTASVDVTVSTLAVSPQISVDTTAQGVVEATNATYNYTLVNNSNGADTFSITAASVDVGMAGAPGLNVNSTATPTSNFTLGASIASVASDVSGNVYIPAGSETNLIVGDEIVISGVGSYTIATMVPGMPASTAGNVTTAETPTRFTTAPIGAAPLIVAGTVPIGTQIGERVVFPVVVTANTPAVAGVNGTHTVNLSGSTTGTDAVGAVVNYATSAGALNETVTTVSSLLVTLVKEVRNVTTGSAFAAAGGTLRSGDTLEYRITATPIPGGGNILTSLVVDEVPTDTAYISGSTTLNGAPVADGAGATLSTTAANGGISINSPTGAAGELVDGESAVLIFRVTIGSPAAGDVITNTANLTFTGGFSNANASSTTIARTVSTIELLQYAPGVTGAVSTAVPTTLFGPPGGPHVLSPDPSTVIPPIVPIPMPGTVDLLPANTYKSGEPVFIRVTDGDQNIDSLVADTILVSVSTPGDSVELLLTETGINTGVFVGYVQTAPVAVIPAAVNDGVISVVINQLLNVNYVDVSDGTDVSADGVLVDPYGIVLSTADGTPLDGATVEIYIASTNILATVFADDGVTPYPASVTSGDAGLGYPSGGYRFPLLPLGDYRIDVTPPPGYSGPSTVSTVAIQALPGAPFSIVTGSRNEDFTVNAGPALHIDIPLDSSASGMFISKQSAKNSVSVGEYLQYQLDVSNTTALPLTNTAIVDVLPVGFRYEPDSTRIGGVTVADPTVSADGRTLTFAIGAMAASSSIDLRYVVAVGVGSKVGEATNLANGSADGGIASNTAQATVTVEEDLMPSSSHLMGRVIAGACSAQDGDKGAVSLQLQSQALKDFIDYSATVKVDAVSVNKLSVVVNLPGTLEFVFGSALLNDITLIDPIVDGKRLVFNLGNGDKDSSSKISFRTRTNLSAFGEFTVRAHARFEDPGGSQGSQIETLFTPSAENKVKDFSRILRPRFDSLSAKLKPQDLEELDDLVKSLRGQEIRQIHVVGHTDNKPIRARSRHLYRDNEALSRARAKSVGDYLKHGLGLSETQIKITGMADKKKILYSEMINPTDLVDGNQLSLNRRVEVLAELKNQTIGSRFVVSQNDSGTRFVETFGPKGSSSGPGVGTNLPGVQGIRLYLEDGRYVDTDDKGMYHFEGLKPGTHVVQVDVGTIPDHMEIFSCEKSTRFAGTPHSQFVDMQGGTLWRADFYLREIPRAMLSGDVGIKLTSKLSNGDLLYRAEIKGGGVPLNNRRLVVHLPFGTQYQSGSAKLDGRSIKDVNEKDGQLIFNLADVGEAKWLNAVSFIVRQKVLLEGEFTTMAVLKYETVDGKPHQSAEVENTLVRQAENKRVLVYLGHYQGIETGLSGDDQIRLEGVIDYLRSKRIRIIEVVAHNDGPSLDEKYRTRYTNNKALAQARAELIGSYISDSLDLYGQQIKRIGKGSDQVSTADPDNSSQNQRVEIFITTADKKAPLSEHLSKPDSGLVESTVYSVPAKSVIHISDEQKAIEDKIAAEKLRMEGVLNVSEGQRFANPSIALRARLDSRLKAELQVDGVVVPNDRIGFKKIDKSTGKTLYTYIGVNLGKPGTHKLTLKGYDNFGNARVDQTINYVRTSEIRSIRVVGTDENVADGKTPVKIRVQLLDKNGDIVKAKVHLELKDSGLRPYQFGEVLPELRRDENTVEVASDGGILFEPVSGSGIQTGELFYNDVTTNFTTYIKPVYRDWIMVGLAEGTLAHNNLSGNTQNIEAADIEDNYYKDGRLAFYAKGTIKGKYLLTASFDSTKEKSDQDNNLFGTIDPDKYYTLYGDATTVRYDAQSTQKLYLKIESDNFYAMFGDYDTGLTVTELGRYSRSLTGLKTEYQDEKISVTAFASETRQAFVKDEIRGQGTSGLYYLSNKNIVLNSESIAIETRDRFRSEVVLETRQLSRYIDYTFDPVDGTIYFREPIYSRDSSFNPVYIVANYEVSSGLDKAITSGGRIAYRPSDGKTELGATLVHEGTVGAEGDLVAADIKYELNGETTLKVEIATTNSKSGSNDLNGNALIAEAITKTDTLEGKAYVRRQEGDFGLGQQMGSETATQKIGVDGNYKLSEQASVNTEVFRQENLATDSVRDVVNANVEYKQDVYSVTGGARYAKDIDGAGDSHESSLITGSVRRSFMGNKLSLHASTEKALDNDENADYPDRFLSGGEYQLTAGTRLFAEHEITKGENQDSSTSRAGLKAIPWKDATLSSSVENQTTEAGPRVFANMGLTQGVQVNQFLKLDFGFEQVKTLRNPGDVPFNINVPPTSGTVSDDFTALSAGANYKKKDWSLTSRAEKRDGEQQDKFGLLLGFYRQQSAGLGMAATLQYFDTEGATGLNNTSTDMEFSLAYRPIKSQWIILNRTRFSNESVESVDGSTRTRKLVNNVNANYLYDRDNQVSFMHGIKTVADTFDGTQYTGITNLFGIEYRHDLARNWDVGAQTSMLISDVGNSNRYSWGVSVGHTLAKNLWISVGVNVEGFADDDFTAANYTASGVYAKFRFAFDHHTSRRAMAWWEKD